MEATGRKKWAVYTIRERKGLEKPIFVRLGIAFTNHDGSFNLHLDATPLDGKLHMREWREEAHAPLDAEGAAEARRQRAAAGGSAMHAPAVITAPTINTAEVPF